MNTEKLRNRDYYLVIDKSGSMDTQDTPSKQSRWDYTKETVTAMARKLSEFDPDGITVVPFANTHRVYANTTPDAVAKIFNENYPNGSTMLAPALQSVFDSYNKDKAAGKAKTNGAIAVVITDGCPNDEDDAAKAIVNFTKTLNDGREEFGILFVQVGQDTNATQYLKRLDDGLTAAGAKWDIVDAKSIDDLGNMSLVDAITGALTD